jgi:hypothetical protein
MTDIDEAIAPVLPRELTKISDAVRHRDWPTRTAFASSIPTTTRS